MAEITGAELLGSPEPEVLGVQPDTAEATEAVEEEAPQEFSSFDARWRLPFEGLTYLGHLEAVVRDIPNHEFLIRTLRVRDKLEVALLTKDYEGYIGWRYAYESAIVAAALVSVDGRPIVMDRTISAVRQKWDYLTSKYHDHVISVLYGRVNDLENQVPLILKELGVLSERRTATQFEDAQPPGGGVG